MTALQQIKQLRLMVIVGMCACIGGAWFAILNHG
jgi:hypothetical protein